jgi:hypothetical protein
VTLLASDGTFQVEQSFSIAVAYVNQPPVFVSEPVTEATAFEEYVYQVIATDPDGDALTITASTLPAWLTLTDNGDGTALLAGTPSNEDAGDHPVTLLASDGTFQVEQSFSIAVAYVNQPPVFVSEPVTEATAFEEYVYQVIATDPDGDALTITAETLPAWLTLTDNGDGTALLAGTPSNEDEGHAAVTLVVSDGELTDEQSFSITVIYVNQPPFFDSEPLTEATAFEEYVYEVVVIDPDGDAIEFETSELPEWLSFTDGGDGTGILQGTPANTDVGAYEITLAATDGTFTVEQAFTLTVTGVLVAPALTSPTSGASSVPLRPQFYWQGIGLPVTFELQIAPEGDFSEAISYSGIGGTNYLIPAPLESGAAYAWRVRAWGGGEAGPFSDPRPFNTTAGTTESGPVVPGGDPITFPESGVQIEFPFLEGEGEVFVTQHTQAPEPPPENLFFVGGTYWTIDFDGPDEFEAVVCFNLDEFDNPGDLESLVVLRRDHDAAEWEELETWLAPPDDPEQLCFMTTQFSDFAAASDKPISTGDQMPAPTELSLDGNYPNPFASHTTITYAVPEAAAVRIVLYDLLGRVVAVLHDDVAPAGRHELRLDAAGLSAGLYVVRLTSEGASLTRRILLAR